MADATASAGLDLEIRAKLDPLDRDLAQANQRLSQFDRSVSTKGLDSLNKSGMRVSVALGDLESQLGATRTAQVGFNQATEASVNPLNKQVAALTAAVDRYDELNKAANDNYKAANDNSKGWATNSVEIAEWGNRIKLAAVAAYTLSPAFRAIVNPAITAGIKATGQALGLMSPALLAAGAAVLRGLAPAFAFLASIALPITAAVAGVKLLSAAFEEGGRQVGELSKQYDKIKATDFSNISFFSDEMTKFSEFARSKSMGGSGGLEELVKTLKDTGNFKGLEDALRTATSMEERFVAVNKAIQDALEAGQRIAALDLASKFFSPDQVRRIAMTGGLIDEVKTKIKQASDTDLVNERNIILAANLRDRLDAAYKSLGEKLFDLTTIGLRFQLIWVNILETLVKIESVVTNLITMFPTMGIVLEQTGKALAGPIVGSLITAYQIASKVAGKEPTLPEGQAQQSLARGLRNPLAVSQAANETINAQTSVLGDASNAAEKYKNSLKSIQDAEDNTYKNTRQLNQAVEEINKTYNEGVKSLRAQAGTTALDPAKLKELQEARDKTIASLSIQKDAWDRAVESQGRAVAVQESESKAIDAGAGAKARYRVEAVLTQAAEQAGIEITGKAAEQYKELGERAERAGQQLAQLKLASDTKFELSQLGRDTTEQDVASKMRSVYGADFESKMDNFEAQQIRTLNNLKQAKDASVDFFGGFAKDIAHGTTLMDALTSAVGRLRDRLIDMLANKLVSQLFNSGGSSLLSLFGGGSTPNPEVGPAINGMTARNALGGIYPSGLSAWRNSVVNTPTMFRFAKGTGLMGEKPGSPGEAIMPLIRGPDGSLGVGGYGGGPAVNFDVKVYNQNGSNVEVNKRKKDNGDFEAEVFVKDVVNEGFSSGEFSPSLNSRNRAPRRVLSR